MGSIHIRKWQYDSLIRLDETPKDTVEHLLTKYLNEEHDIHKDPKDSAAYKREQEAAAPQPPPLTVDMIIGKMMWANDELTPEAAQQLIDDEIKKSGGLLTPEAAAHVVARNLDVDLHAPSEASEVSGY